MKNVTLLLLVLLIGACCSATPAPSPERRNEVVTEPHGQVAPAPAPTDSVAPQPESVAPEPESVEPLPDSFDCAQPAPLTPCCRAMLPKCTQCTERNRAVDAAYRAQCDTPK